MNFPILHVLHLGIVGACADTCSCSCFVTSGGAPSLPGPTAAASVPVPSGSTNPQSFSKRGIAYNDVHLANTFNAHCPSCGWAYMVIAT